MKNPLKRIVPALLAVAIIASIGWYLLVYDRDFTRDTLLSQARFHETQGSSKLASWFYDLAYNFSDQDENVAIELAEQYKAHGNYSKAEYTLTNAIADGGTAELYIALCKTFVEQDKLLDAVNMLDKIGDSAIKAELDAQRPAAPAADPAPGLYSQYISVSFTTDKGLLFCTTDGEYPSIKDEPCTEPIPLSGGETTIYAVTVAENGLVSPLTVVGYTVGGVIEEVTFTDPAMEAAIREALGVDAEKTLMTDELWTITQFTVPADAASLDDLTLLPYVENLTIQNMTLDSLSSLAGLTELSTLDLTGCRFPAESLVTLANLPSLQHLTLANCGLSTIADLSGAQNLTYLDLSSNTLRNLEVLSSINSLIEVNLQHNAVVDLSALAILTNLETLDVSYNSLTSLASIASSPKLKWLDASHNSLTTLEGVSSLAKLNHLAVDSNQLTDVSILGQCTGLTELSMATNAITDISALSTLTALEVFDFAYNEVETLPAWPDGSALMVIDGSYNKLASIDGLKNMENLSYVYMDYNELTSVDAIANCYHLVMVNVYGNEISDVSALTSHNIIVNYDPT